MQDVSLRDADSASEFVTDVYLCTSFFIFHGPAPRGVIYICAK